MGEAAATGMHFILAGFWQMPSGEKYGNGVME